MGNWVGNPSRTCSRGKSQRCNDVEKAICNGPITCKELCLCPDRTCATHSTTAEPSSSDCVISSSDWSLSRSQGSRDEVSASSSTGAMLGRRLPEPFSAGSASLLLLVGRHSVFCRSMATVPGRSGGGSTALYKEGKGAGPAEHGTTEPRWDPIHHQRLLKSKRIYRVLTEAIESLLSVGNPT